MGARGIATRAARTSRTRRTIGTGTIGALRGVRTVGRIERARTCRCCCANVGSAVRTQIPIGIERMMAGGTKVLQTLMAVRAEYVIGLDRVVALRAFAILEKLTLFEGYVKCLLVAIGGVEIRTQDAIGDHTDHRDAGDNAPKNRIGTAALSVADDPNDRQDVERYQEDGAHHQDQAERGSEHICHRSTFSQKMIAFDNT